MPRTPVKLAAPPKTDPLLRTRGAIHSRREAATRLRLPRYTAQRVFYRCKDGVKTSIMASPIEAKVLIHAGSVARRILRAGKSECYAADGLHHINRLAIDAELLPTAAQMTKSELRERIGDWMKGANMVVYIDDGIEACALTPPNSEARDIYIAARLVKSAVFAHQLPDQDAYKRSILHLAFTLCQECQHLMGGAILGPVKSIPSGCSTREDHQTTSLDRYLHYVAEAGWFWADAVFGGEIAGIVDEVDQNDSPVLARLALQNAVGYPDYYFIEDSIVKRIINRGEDWSVELPISPQIGTEVHQGVVAAATRRHYRPPVEVPPELRIRPENVLRRTCEKRVLGQVFLPRLPEMEVKPELQAPPENLVMGRCEKNGYRSVYRSV